MPRYALLCAGLLVAAALAAWKWSTAGAASPAAAPPGSPEVAAPAAPAAPAGETPEPEPFVGVLVPPGSADLVARLDGRVAKVLVRVGDPVKRGDVLIALDVAGLRREAEIAEAETGTAIREEEVAAVAAAEAEQRLARRADPRQLSLGAVSPEELASAQFEHRAAVARLEAARARIRERQARAGRLQQELAEAEIRAPFDGVVARRLVDPGAVVKPGQVLLREIQQGEPLVRFAVPEAFAARVTREAPLRIELPSGSLPGRVSNVAPEVDAAARVVFAEGLLEPAPGVVAPPAGTVVRVRVLPQASALGRRP